MTDPAQIFRSEALAGRSEALAGRSEALAGRSEALAGRAAQLPPSGSAPATPRWMAAAYWALLALLAAGLAAGALIRVGSQPLIVALTAGLFSGAADG